MKNPQIETAIDEVAQSKFGAVSPNRVFIAIPSEEQSKTEFILLAEQTGLCPEGSNTDTIEAILRLAGFRVVESDDNMTIPLIEGKLFVRSKHIGEQR